jgi:hypothetical protein
MPEGQAFDRCLAARHVFVAVPAYISKLEYDCSFSIIQFILALKASDIAVTMIGLNGNCYIDYARNVLVGDFLESDATDLLFIDTDVGFDPQTGIKLVRATRPVVAAIYPKKTDDESYPVDFVKGSHTIDDEGLIEAKMVPTGLLRINRKVFEVMPAKTYKNGHGRMDKAYFETDIRDQFYGEDVEFCRKWREMGGKIRVLPDETLSHTGPKAWIGNVGQALRAGKF